MAFPVVEATATSSSDSAVTSHSVTLPASSAGELLVAVFQKNGSAEPLTTPTGWNQESVDDSLHILWKVATGSEGTTLSVTTTNAQRAASLAYRISGHDSDVEVAFVDATIDPPNLAPSWGTGDNLWIAVARGRTSNYTFVAPTNYTNLIQDAGEDNSSSTSRNKVASAQRNLAASSENPGAFTFTGVGTPNTQQAATIVIRPLGIIDPINPTTDANGFDITVDSTNTTPSNFDIKVNGGSAFNPQSVRQISATQVRLRVPNGNRILSGDTVTVSSTADSVTDESATNNSVQTSTTVAIPTANGGRVTYTFASAPTVGILASGEPTVTNAVNVTGVTYTAGTNEEQYRIGGSAVDPETGPGTEHPFHPDAVGYNAATAASFPLTLSADECLVSAVSLPDLVTHATSTEFSLGDTIEENGRYYRVTTAGTTSGTKPSFTTQTVTDGFVTWTRGGSNGTGDDGRSLVRKIAVLHCSGATLKSQDTYRCSFYSGATKTYYTRSDLNTSILPGDTTGFSDVSVAEGQCQYVWFDTGNINGGSGSEAMPEENMGHPYGRDMASRAAQAVSVAMSAASYTDNLIDYLVQRGIDYIGCREGGGYWPGFEGWPSGRLTFPLFAAALLEDSTESIINTIKTPVTSDEQLVTGDWRGYGEHEQTNYVTLADLDATMDGGLDYFSGNGGTYAQPSTYVQTPSNGSFPATIRDSWLHVPEYGGRIRRDPTGDDNGPNWNLTYRQCCTAISWGFLVYMMDSLGIIDTVGIPAYVDYTRRYQYIQGPDGADDSWNFQTEWALFEANEPAFAFTASAVNVAGTWYIDLNFNRYATQTNANIIAQFACSGSITLSNADQTGPRTFRVQASADPRGQTITYTQSGTAANRVVDSGNNELPTASTARVPVAGTGQVQVEGTIRMNFQLPSGLWGSTITKTDANITAVSQVTGGTRTYTVGSVTGAGTSTLQVILTPTPLIYSVAAGGAVTVTIDEDWLTDENGNTTAAFSGIADGDNSSTQVPPSSLRRRLTGGSAASFSVRIT